MVDIKNLINVVFIIRKRKPYRTLMAAKVKIYTIDTKENTSKDNNKVIVVYVIEYIYC